MIKLFYIAIPTPVVQLVSIAKYCTPGIVQAINCLMRFLFFDHVIGNHRINLDALQPNTNLYSTLLLQHKGVFFADQHRFGNRDDTTAIFNSFLQLAKNEQASISVTPEYSCPWNTIRWILANEDNRPAESKLWALGCESITPAELRQLRETYQNENILIHFDEAALNSGVNALVNPLCYVFNARNNETGDLKLVLLIQFKTEHMGVWTDDIEQERYIPGNEIYVLRNDTGSIALFTMICSETESFQISPVFRDELDNRWDANSFIILNIQMNPQPSALFFRTFRNSILNYVNKDIISLNWSDESTKANGGPLIQYSKSSVSYESHDMEFTSEDKFQTNHSLGLYYTNKRQRRHMYFLNGAQNVFLIVHSKPIPGGVAPALLIRTGPLARSNYSWDNGASNFVPAAPLNDGFRDFLDANGSTNAVLHDQEVSFIDKERLINLSTGQVKVKATDRVWHSIDKLQSFMLEDDEVIRRLTFTQDEAGDDTRRNYLEKIDILNSIITTRPELFSPNHRPFLGNCSGAMFKGVPRLNYKYNLVTQNGLHKATVAFIGRNTLANAEKILKILREVFDEDDESRKLAIVWYKPDAETISPVYDIRRSRATGDSIPKSNSINRP